MSIIFTFLNLFKESDQLLFSPISIRLVTKSFYDLNLTVIMANRSLSLIQKRVPVLTVFGYHINPKVHLFED